MARRDEQTPARILGLTGPIGCGKTTVGDMLLDLGALERIDADRVVHGLMAPGTATTEHIASAFGDSVLARDGSVDRARLGRMVFANTGALRQLESIVHPAVRAAIRSELETWSSHDGVVVVDAVRLLQSDLLELCDAVWVVRCDPSIELDRLTQRRGMTVEDARHRMAAQPSFDHPAVTAVIDNSASLLDLKRQVETAWSAFQTHRRD